MAEEWSQKGTWSAWDGRRTIWFTAFNRTLDDDTPIPAAEVLDGVVGLEEGEKLDEWRHEALIGRGVFRPHEEEGKSMWNLKAFTAVDGGLALLNIFLDEPTDRDWAVEQWHSLSNPGPVREE